MTSSVKTKHSKEDKVIISDYGIIPPNDKRIEDAVLGALLIDCNAFSRVCEKHSPSPVRSIFLADHALRSFHKALF